MTGFHRITHWLRTQRSSTRLSFALQLVCRVLMSVFALLWTPLLLGNMGRAMNGLFTNLHALASLGGLGDLGLGGLVNIQTSRLLGQEKNEELQKSLTQMRGFFLLLAGLIFWAGVIFVPHLLTGARFEDVPGAGSMLILTLVMAVAMSLVVVNSYVSNLSYGCGNTLWPALPTFILWQLAALGLFLLARQRLPLWLLYLPYLAATIGLIVMNHRFVRISHPHLAKLRPVLFSWQNIGGLFGKNIWVYLYTVSNGIYIATDQFLVSHKFGAATVPLYTNNAKLCELALFVVNAACLVSLPKITQWLAAPDPAGQERARTETMRLSRFQFLLGCTAALSYLAINETFIRLWIGREYCAPLNLQIAFALLLVVSAAGQAGFELAGRCAENGVRTGGITVMAAAVLNFTLSWLAMRQGWLWGIALATAVAQSFAMLLLGKFSSRHMQLSWWRLTLRNWLLGLAVVGLGAWEHDQLAAGGAQTIALITGADVLALALVARLAGLKLADLRHEWNILKAFCGR